MLNGPTIASVVALSLLASAALAQSPTPPPSPTPSPAPEDTSPPPPAAGDMGSPESEISPPPAPQPTPSVSPAGAFAPAYSSGSPPPSAPEPEEPAPAPTASASVDIDATPPPARSVVLDVGLGPALGIGHNRAKYETILTPVDAEQPPTWRVVRTEQGLNLDVIVSVSAYLWKARDLNNDQVFDVWQIIPRPMVGISLDRPFDVIYAGIQLDPIEYLNIAGGVRIGNEQKLIGPQLLDPALRDPDGEPQPPVTREEVKASGFVALTVSTNLVYRWLKGGE